MDQILMAGRRRPSAIIEDTGVAYGTVCGAPPEPGTLAFKAWLLKLQNYRARECPVWHPTKWFFSTSGDDGEDGLTWATAKQTLAHCQTLIDALAINSTHRIQIIFKDDDVWFEDTGLLITGGRRHISLCRSGDGLNAPLFNRFSTSYSSGWTNTSGDTWQRSVTGLLPAYLYVDADGYESIFERATSLAGVNAGNLEPSARGIFWNDRTADILYVNLGGTDPNTVTIRVCMDNSASGAEALAHGSRIHGIDGLGWGINYGDQATQATPVKLGSNGTDVCYASNCRGFYSGTHAMAFYGGAGGSGGFSVFDKCTAGLCGYSSSGATVFNSYVGNGGQETLFTWCNAKYGRLPDHQWFSLNEVSGRAIFAHTSGTAASLLVSYGCSHTPGKFSAGGPTRFVNAPAAAAIADSRALAVNETLWLDPGLDSNDSCDFAPGNMVVLNCAYRYRTSWNALAFTNTNQNGFAINTHFDCDFDLFSAAVQACWNATSAHSPDFFHCKFVCRNYDTSTGTQELRFPDYDTNSAAGVFENCVIAHVDNVEQINVQDNVGFDYCGYYNTDGDFGGDANAVTITSEDQTQLDYVPTVSDDLYQAGKSLAVTVEIDRNWKARDLVNPSLGDISP